MKCPCCALRLRVERLLLHRRIERALRGPWFECSPSRYLALLDHPNFETPFRLKRHEFLAGAVGRFNGKLVRVLPEERFWASRKP